MQQALSDRICARAASRMREKLAPTHYAPDDTRRAVNKSFGFGQKVVKDWLKTP
jgi:transposase